MTSVTTVAFDEDLIARYGGRGPRYTSYPTALKFSDAFTADNYRRHAALSNESGRPLSLYVHIPFCHSLCYYCACNKIVTRNAVRVHNYLRSLHQEIVLQAELFDNSRPVEQLHFGGGTPTYLNHDEMRDLFELLHRNFSFDASDARQFSIEVDPRTVDGGDMALLAELGFNRLSLGVQDFDPVVQRAINRVQSVDQVRELLHRSRDSGFRSVSFDLIYGLPHQSVHSFDSTLGHVVAMRPDRLAIYNYAHLPQRFKGQRMIRDADIPDPDIKLEILHHTIDRLSEAGYIYIGMDHFALPEDELVIAQQNQSLQRNFQGYSTHAACDLIGLGVSAIGSIGGAFAQNSPSTAVYEEMLGQSKLPIIKGVALDEDDVLRADIIQTLMCHGELRIADIESHYQIDFATYFAEELTALDPLADDGLVDEVGVCIRVTPKGRLLLRSIAMVFDRYLRDADQRRFSKAI